MAVGLSPRLAAIMDALPLEPGMRVLEIGCGPGAAARAMASRLVTGHIVAIDRSAKAVAQATAGATMEIAAGRMSVRHMAIEDFALEPGEPLFHIAFASTRPRGTVRSSDSPPAPAACLSVASRSQIEVGQDGAVV
jgi:SAM-dependent methyltransferase